MEDMVITSYRNKDVEAFNKLIRDQFWQEQGNSNPEYLQSKDMIRFKSALHTERFSRRNNPILYQNGEEVMIEQAELINTIHFSFWKCTIKGRSTRDFIRVVDSDSSLAFNEILNNYATFARKARFPYNKEHWKLYFQLKNAFADIQYVYASTIHKLQGSTYDTTFVDLSMIINSKSISDDLKFRLTYVAITRARKKIKIFY
jgi:ATP-dependent exoDNAse (exonuclease V) alpha subunit